MSSVAICCSGRSDGRAMAYVPSLRPLSVSGKNRLPMKYTGAMTDQRRSVAARCSSTRYLLSKCGTPVALFAEATEPLNSLATADDLELLRANANVVDGAVQKVADTFDVLSTTKEVRHIRMSEVWSGPIASVEDLDSALGRLREAVLDQLNDDTVVRFR